jgi:hypothetical protein
MIFSLSLWFYRLRRVVKLFEIFNNFYWNKTTSVKCFLHSGFLASGERNIIACPTGDMDVSG